MPIKCKTFRRHVIWQNIFKFNDVISSATSIQAMYWTYIVVTNSGHCFVLVFFFFYTFLCWQISTRHIHVKLQFFHQLICERRDLIALPSFHWLKTDSVKQAQRVEFTGQKSITVKLPAKSHPVPSFRRFMSLVYWVSWNLLEQICGAHHSKVWAQLFLLILYAVFNPVQFLSNNCV